LVLLRKNPRRSHPQPTDTRSAGANRSPLHPTKLPPRPRTAISGCMAIGFGMGKGREGGGGPNSGPFYLVLCGPARACWRHSRGIQRRPRRGGSLVSGARQRPLTQVYEQGPLPACIPARSNFYLASCHTSTWTWISTGCGTLDTCFGEQSSYTRAHNACIPSLSHAGKACHRVLPHPAGLVRMYFATAPLQALSRPCRLRARRVRGYKPRLRYGFALVRARGLRQVSTALGGWWGRGDGGRWWLVRELQRAHGARRLGGGRGGGGGWGGWGTRRWWRGRDGRRRRRERMRHHSRLRARTDGRIARRGCRWRAFVRRAYSLRRLLWRGRRLPLRWLRRRQWRRHRWRWRWQSTRAEPRIGEGDTLWCHI
jgi:hypothetical protein